jgi:hypothetical protein
VECIGIGNNVGFHRRLVRCHLSGLKRTQRTPGEAGGVDNLTLDELRSNLRSTIAVVTRLKKALKRQEQRDTTKMTAEEKVKIALAAASPEVSREL